MTSAPKRVPMSIGQSERRPKKLLDEIRVERRLVPSRLPRLFALIHSAPYLARTRIYAMEDRCDGQHDVGSRDDLPTGCGSVEVASHGARSS